jgi:hypothetical protein
VSSLLSLSKNSSKTREFRMTIRLISYPRLWENTTCTTLSRTPFCAQLLQDLAEQPVDDIGVEWDPEKYPFDAIATIIFPPQDSGILAFRAWWDDRITVNSWHGLEVHRPLGSTNRMRRVVYAESRKLRLRVNGFGEGDYVEPEGIEDVLIGEAMPDVGVKG